MPAPITRRALFSWAMYDWATGAFFTLVSTFLYATYVTEYVAADPDEGKGAWSAAIGIAALVIALLAPGLGAAADLTRRKPWLVACTAVCVVATAAMALVAPDPSDLGLALGLIVVATIGAELAMVFYNAMLPDLVPPARIGRWSGWGWAAGYAGGLLCLVLALFGLVGEDPWLTLDGLPGGPVRLACILAAAWFAVFTLPLLLWTPDRARGSIGAVAAIRGGYGQLFASLSRLRATPDILRFLVARMLFTDGLTTIFTLGGVFAAGVLDLDGRGILIFGIAINVAAGCGAFGLAWLDDALGPKRTILACLGVVVIAVVALLTTDDAVPFWTAAMVMGACLGPVQSAGRSMMAHMAPPDLRGELFGLFAFAGKATAFLGPWCVWAIQEASGSFRLGLSSVLIFLVLGAALLCAMREPATGRATLDSPPGPG